MILEVATPDSCLVESVLGAAFKGRNMQDNNSVDLSPAATTIAFDPIIPLLRVPLQAGENDDPSKGPYVLAFKDEDSWRRAWLTCESKLVEQCEVQEWDAQLVRPINANLHGGKPCFNLVRLLLNRLRKERHVKNMR